ncbi:MAG: BMC domain-containing protein, partial [Acidiferrobacter sp.]
CERVGDGLVAAHIIARVHSEVEHILPKRPDGDGGGRDGDVTGNLS